MFTCLICFVINKIDEKLELKLFLFENYIISVIIKQNNLFTLTKKMKESFIQLI